ncbi:hypothetical protein [Nocardia sp. XZ_19_369]|uniref:hypothetical protein n=1 Tax=Nocardia sp. XZ_19_369 TaxID=2769487 RepID=UPI00188F0046|nr:hypothetical protein [Nocardia sp. XZ_19_369]
MNAESLDRSGRPQLLVRDVVRDVIAEVASEELSLVDRLRQLDDEHVVRLLSRRRHGRDLLGFGIDDMVVLASPVVWVAVNEAAKRFTNDAITGGGKAARFGLRTVFRRTGAESTVPPLTREQIAEIRTQIVDSAVRSGMADDRAQVIADSVAGRLLLSVSTDAHEPPADP